MTDREIMGIYASGDSEAAFNAIVQSYGERIYWHVRRFTCSHEDSDDLLQEIFIKVWKALPDFRSESSLYTWIYRIATNETLNFLRKKRLRALLSAESLETLLDRQADEDVHFNGDALQREVQKAINSLPDKQKQVFVLRYFEEMTYEEISEITRISVGSLKASYHHASKKVRERLEKIF